LRPAAVLFFGVAAFGLALSPDHATASAPAIVTGGTSHSCAVLPAGVFCWGSNAGRQLGDGTSTDRPAAVAVASLGRNVRSIASSANHSCAVTNSGEALCWGNDVSGELGAGPDAMGTSNTPIEVAGLSNVEQVATGARHSCARTAGGTVYCWGWNGLGQVSPGAQEIQRTPVEVAGLGRDIVSVAAADFQNCAVTANGGVRCWGADVTPEAVGTAVVDWLDADGELFTDAVSIESGIRHTCVLRANATASCWGNNASGQLGNGSRGGTLTPVVVQTPDREPLTGIAAISLGGDLSCALLGDRSVMCWGENEHGQLGDGTTSDRTTATGVVGLSRGVVAAGAGRNHACAVLLSGEVRCWGMNTLGQVGAETNEDCGSAVFMFHCSRTPLPVEGIATAPAAIAGDADCDGSATSRDATLVLQFGAKLLGTLRCLASADADGNGGVAAPDAALILQSVAGLTELG
ncbi:MAG: hypothetical protein WD939_09265, partial [Dehalococcoidia bacterium]